MDIDKYLASPWIKYAVIGLGVLTMLCSVYDMANGTGMASYSLSCLGCSITVFAILLFLYHHDETFKNALSSSSSLGSTT